MKNKEMISIIRRENLSNVREIIINEYYLKFFFKKIKLFNNHDGGLMGYPCHHRQQHRVLRIN